MRKVTKHVYETSDGKAFDIKEDAIRHESGLTLADFLDEHFPASADCSPGTAMAEVILDNLDDFAKIIRPLIRKPRTAKAEAQADEYEAAMKKGKVA